MDLAADSSFGSVVLEGSLWASIPLAALAGLISFASPCVLPLVPGYLAYVTGLTGNDLQRKRRGRMFAGTALFILGFSVVFVLMSVVLAQIGAAPWVRGQTWIQVVLGLVVILLGVVFMGGLSWFQKDRKIHSKPPAGLWGAPILGITFGLGWAPCIGPTFAAVQALVFIEGPNSLKAIGLTLAYCLGLGVPFLLIALGFRKSAEMFDFLRKHRRALQIVGGIALVVVGVLMATGLWAAMMSWLQASSPGYELPV
ncbi:cytochrome c biogenesis CcdA family protein [Rothia sp. HC945]|uniref:cytochrome c biogenesis CcdA family protein n=1 Tax=Rothia sp. HC945 TaxID=3171170 RepID=UPI00265373E4|nr:cytochrome c biogenesis CcdA family protein [Kocuria sp.]